VYADYLEHGDIVMPSRRTTEAKPDRLVRHHAAPAHAPRSGRRESAVTLAAAAVVGWMLGRRR
jgi:hypothetical protein